MKLFTLAFALMISNSTFAYSLFSNEMNAEEKAVYDAMVAQSQEKTWTKEELEANAKQAERSWRLVMASGVGSTHKCTSTIALLEANKSAGGEFEKKNVFVKPSIKAYCPSELENWK